MLRKVRLYGQLAEFVGRKVIEADLSSAAEAVRMLIGNFPELDRHMADQNYRVLVGDGALTLDDLHNPVGQEEIKICTNRTKGSRAISTSCIKPCRGS